MPEFFRQKRLSEIKQFYQQQSGKSGNRLIVVFGILGAILVGLGIILIIAHNWDDLSKGHENISCLFAIGSWHI
jgi:uncharacterized membrane protein